MFDIAKFSVEIGLEKVCRIPYSSGSVYCRWNVLDSPRPDAHGRTNSANIEKDQAALDYTATFRQRIGLRTPSKYLRSSALRIEVMWEPIGGRAVNIGTLNLDMSQFARPNKPTQTYYSTFHKLSGSQGEKHRHSDKQKDAHSEASSNSHALAHSQSALGSDHGCSYHANEVYDKSMLYLLKGAKNNCLLNVRIKLDYLSGTQDFKTPAFDGPAMANSIDDATGLENESLSDLHGSQRARERLRRLKNAVFEDLMNRDSSRAQINGDCDWLDFDSFLMCNHVRVTSSDFEKEFERHGIQDVGASSFEDHKKGTPFLETDIRENFVNWKVMHA